MNRPRTKVIDEDCVAEEDLCEVKHRVPIKSLNAARLTLGAFPSSDEIDAVTDEQIKKPVVIDSTVCTPRSNSARFLQNDQVVAFVGQQYDVLRAECKAAKKLFEDPYFPANDKSLFYSEVKNSNIKWKRPKEIHKDAKFIVDGMTRYDVDQGDLGDCWFLASIAALVMKSEQIRRVIPDGQSFDDNSYAGIFHFRFWFFGQWVDVVIDDRLPTIDGKLAYLKSTHQPNEFWPALLEKAYAKLVGNYEALQGGSEDEAMEDLTGGIAYSVTFKDENRRRLPIPPTLFDTMKEAMEGSSIICSAINPISGRVGESVLPNGLVAGHAYTISGVRVLQSKSGSKPTQLVRVRNPWGDAHEWNGAWSDKSPQWQQVDREAVGLKVEADGEFWMDFNDFITFFDRVTICYIGPDSIPEYRNTGQSKLWKEVLIRDQWIAHVNAGGSVSIRKPPSEKFWTNPQYVLKVSGGTDNSEKSIICGLMQVDRRRLRMLQGTEMLYICPIIYSLTPDGKADKLLNQRPVEYSQLRQSQFRMRLKPGEYLLVASTADADEPGHFLLRIFAESGVSAVQTDSSPLIANTTEIISPTQRYENQASELFKATIKGAGAASSEIDSWTLQKILNENFRKVIPFKYAEFSLETSRSLLCFLDADQSGKLGLAEFTKLWIDLHNLLEKFVARDKSNSGSINADLMKELLESIGIRPSVRMLNSMVKKYCKADGTLSFDDYVLCITRARTCVELFKAQRKENETIVKFDFDQFMQVFTYL